MYLAIGEKFGVIKILVILLLVLFVWSPWTTDKYAKGIVLKEFNNRVEDSGSNCTLDCEDCGVKESKWAIFGRSVRIEYRCDLGSEENQTAWIKVTIPSKKLGIPSVTLTK